MTFQSTASLRAPTGLDRGAREAMLRVMLEAGVQHMRMIIGLFRRGAHGGIDDYLAGVAEGHGQAAEMKVRAGMREMIQRHTDDLRLDFEQAQRDASSAYGPVGFLVSIPAPDFLTAIEAGAAEVTDPFEAAGVGERLNRVCQVRGVPFRVVGVGRQLSFEWTGDAVTQQVVEPALSALDDPRLARGPRVEFNSARERLRAGTPEARRHAVGDACNAVESAMKVLLDARKTDRPKRENAQDLFNALVAAGALPQDGMEIVLAANRFGNRRGRHGGGPVAHDVGEDEAQAVISSAAAALTFIAARLP